jgi:hypothetical protein
MSDEPVDDIGSSSSSGDSLQVCRSDDDVLHVAIQFQLYSLAGEVDAEFRIDEDATIGQLIARLNGPGERPRIWYEKNKFAIGNRVFDFKDPYLRFMNIAEVRKNIRVWNGQRLVYASLVKPASEQCQRSRSPSRGRVA